MGLGGILSFGFFCGLIVLLSSKCSSSYELGATPKATLVVNGSPQLGRKIPDRLFGIFFEEINHAGAGGLWAELVSNRGFEAGGQNTPSNIAPWSVIGNDSYLVVSTDRTSCFSRNIVALRVEVLCDNGGANICPDGGVGIYNPGYWGMNIEQGKTYELILYVKSLDSVDISAKLTSSDGSIELASSDIILSASDVSNWTKVDILLYATGTNTNSRLQLTTNKIGVIWLDQVSLLPSDTYKGHGFRKDLVSMLENLKPGFIRFPGGCFVEGDWLRNAFRWRETIGPWEERPGHFGDVWLYWTDDGLGYFEFLQLAEDLGSTPVWVVNNGISHNDEVDTSAILPFVQEALNSIEFARGAVNSTWGSVRAAMGHPDPFTLNYVAIGNEDCWKTNYLGNYLQFYYAIKAAYPDINIISNCDGSSQTLNHPADLYDFHIYTSANDMFSKNHKFDGTSRDSSRPKAFVSEYAVTGSDAGSGSLWAALAEAAFLIGLERNSDVVEMASYAPLFVNDNDRRWNPDSIVFNSWQSYGTPSYWMQQFFRDSSGSIFQPSVINADPFTSLAASAITWQSTDGNTFLKIKVVNFGQAAVNLNITVVGLQNAINSVGSTKTVLTSPNVRDENSFFTPDKIVPRQSSLLGAGTEMDLVIDSNSLTSFDLLLDPETYISSI